MGHFPDEVSSIFVRSFRRRHEYRMKRAASDGMMAGLEDGRVLTVEDIQER